MVMNKTLLFILALHAICCMYSCTYRNSVHFLILRLSVSEGWNVIYVLYINVCSTEQHCLNSIQMSSFCAEIIQTTHLANVEPITNFVLKLNLCINQLEQFIVKSHDLPDTPGRYDTWLFVDFSLNGKYSGTRLIRPRLIRQHGWYDILFSVPFVFRNAFYHG